MGSIVVRMRSSLTVSMMAWSVSGLYKLFVA